MKLSTDQIAATRDALGASPLPEDHPAMAQLQQVFGEHTFYVDQNGLLVFVDPAQAELPESELELPEGDPRLVMIAAWTDENKQALGPVQPIDTGVTLPEDGAAEKG